MKGVRLTLFSTAFVVIPSPAIACPFCETGGRDAALFIGVFFGLFALGLASVALAYSKAGAFRKDLKLEDRALKAEGIEAEEKK
ncbi:MAG: hypothetical protein HYY13_07575 [Nitrospirae bacterium]|nr:hypothetical protein [Nitrospirota bacterium]